MSAFGNNAKERMLELASATSGLFCSYIGHDLALFREVPYLPLSDASDLRFLDEKTPCQKARLIGRSGRTSLPVKAKSRIRHRFFTSS
jgi:hypothetical protein